MVKYKDTNINMSSKFNQYLVLLVVFGVVLANAAFGYASDGSDGMQSFILNSDEELESAEVPDPAAESSDSRPDSNSQNIEEAPNLVKQDEFLGRIRQELNLSKTDYHQLLNSIVETKKRLEKVMEEKMDLKKQLASLDAQIAETQEKLLAVIKQVIQKENEIALLYEQIEVREIALQYQKNLLKDYIKILYQEENAFLTLEDDGSVNALKLLLADGSVSDNLRKLDYFNLLNEAGQQMVDTLDRLAKELKGKQIDLDKKRQNLTILQTELETEKQQLNFQKEAKENLLNITNGQEDIYKQLLEQSIKEQGELINDIKNLSNAVAFIESKITEDGPDFDPDKYLALLDYKTQALYNFKINTAGIFTEDFSWPVDPDKGISAYFRDPTYVSAFGVQHNAIDIPAYQGSPVRVAEDGVVYTARDNGYGYSYVIVAHAGGFMSVYGHCSNVLVEAGQTLAKGSIICLSGGMPGTKGAGFMTTGPHLHFEMLLNGLYVDPLDYLPIEILSEEQIEALPEKYHDDWENAVLEAQVIPVLR